MAIDEATGAESKAENKYDTRSTEASYLARGQAERVAALRTLVSFVSSPASRLDREMCPVGLCSLVALEDQGGTMWVFVAPGGGGLRFEVDGVAVVIVTPDSPLGKALIGQEEGAEISFQTAAGDRELEIVALR